MLSRRTAAARRRRWCRRRRKAEAAASKKPRPPLRLSAVLLHPSDARCKANATQREESGGPRLLGALSIAERRYAGEIERHGSAPSVSPRSPFADSVRRLVVFALLFTSSPSPTASISV